MADDPLDQKRRADPGSATSQLPRPVSSGGNLPLTTTPVVGELDRALSAVYVPGTEPLAEGELRVVVLGSGNPFPRPAQASTGFLVELGPPADSFLFVDLGTGTVANFNALCLPQAGAGRVFLTHLHVDHTGDLAMLRDEVMSERAGPLEVWGPDADEPRLGTAAFIEGLEQATAWETASKRGRLQTSGARFSVHEFDYRATHEVLREDGLTVTAFPAIHMIGGAVGYRVDWHGRSVVFSGDGKPSLVAARVGQNCDLFLHEATLPVQTLVDVQGMTREAAERFAHGPHSLPAAAGRVFVRARPRLAALYHLYVNDSTVSPVWQDLRATWKGPAAICQDLTVFTVTEAAVVTRQARVDPAPWPTRAEDPPDLPPTPQPRPTPKWLRDLAIPDDDLS